MGVPTMPPGAKATHLGQGGNDSFKDAVSARSHPGPAVVWVKKGVGELPGSDGSDYSRFPSLPQGK